MSDKTRDTLTERPTPPSGRPQPRWSTSAGTLERQSSSGKVVGSSRSRPTKRASTTKDRYAGDHPRRGTGRQNGGNKHEKDENHENQEPRTENRKPMTDLSIGELSWRWYSTQLHENEVRILV